MGTVPKRFTEIESNKQVRNHVYNLQSKGLYPIFRRYDIGFFEESAFNFNILSFTISEISIYIGIALIKIP